MTIAAFVDPTGQDRHLAIDLATAIAEYSVIEDRTLYLLSDAAAALAIGLALIGMRAPPTIEGSDYHDSPIKLLPFLPRPEGSENGIMQTTGEDGVVDEIQELRSLGLFVDFDGSDGEGKLTGDPLSAFQAVISSVPELIIGLGADSELWQIVSDGPEGTDTRHGQKIVSIEGFAPENINTPVPMVVVRTDENLRFQSADVDADDSRLPYFVDTSPELVDQSRRAHDSGLLVASLLEFLINSRLS